MKLFPLLIVMGVLGLVAGIVFSSWVTVLFLAPASVAIGYVAGRTTKHKELP